MNERRILWVILIFFVAANLYRIHYQLAESVLFEIIGADYVAFFSGCVTYLGRGTAGLFSLETLNYIQNAITEGYNLDPSYAGRTLPVIYPPITFLPFVPLLPFSLQTGFMLWIIFSIAATFLSALFLCRQFEKSDPVWWALAVTIALPSFENIYYGSVDALMCILVLGIASSYLKGKDFLFGATIGLSTFKFSLGLMFTPLLLLSFSLRSLIGFFGAWLVVWGAFLLELTPTDFYNIESIAEQMRSPDHSSHLGSWPLSQINVHTVFLNLGYKENFLTLISFYLIGISITLSTIAFARNFEDKKKIAVVLACAICCAVVFSPHAHQHSAVIVSLIIPVLISVRFLSRHIGMALLFSYTFTYLVCCFMQGQKRWLIPALWICFSTLFVAIWTTLKSARYSRRSNSTS